MFIRNMLPSRVILLATLLAAFTITAVHAGAPLMCYQFDIGDAPCLPWGAETFDKSKSYDPAKVVDDTLALLTADAPVLSRMETLRRAVLYIDRNQARADELLGSLLTRTLDAEVVMDARVLALRYFDAGYLAATLQQSGIEASFGPVSGEHNLHRVPGYAWLVRGYKLADQDRDFAIALALVTADTRMTEHTMFLERAVTSSPADDAARNGVLAWICQIRGTSLDAVRAKYPQISARP